MDDPSVPINSVKRSYEIIDAIRDRERAGVTELADALDRPKSTVHNHLQTLEQLGYVVTADGQYRLSTRYFHIGWESRSNHEVFAHGVETVKRLEQESGRHVQLVVEENGMGSILFATHWQHDDHTPTAGRLSPTRAYLHSNAPGKALLAQLPPERLSSIIDRHGLPERTERTIVDESALRSELATIREQGYAVDRGEMIDGSAGVGAAIVADDRVYGAIAVYGPTREIHTEIESGDIVSLLREHAEAISADITFATTE